MKKRVFAALIAAPLIQANAANTVTVTTSSGELTWTTFSGEDTGCQLLRDCSVVNISSGWGGNRTITFDVDFYIGKPTERLAFELSSLWFQPSRPYEANTFPISISKIEWEISVFEIASNQSLYSRSLSYLDKNPGRVAIDLAGYVDTTLRASFEVNILAGYSLATSTDPLCDSVFCMPVFQRREGIGAVIAVGAIPEPSALLMFIPAAAIVAARRWKSAQSSTRP